MTQPASRFAATNRTPDTSNTATAAEGASLLAKLQNSGKNPAGAVSALMLALAMLMKDQNDEDKLEAAYAALPDAARSAAEFLETIDLDDVSRVIPLH